MNYYIITGASRGLGKALVESLRNRENTSIFYLSRTEGDITESENIRYIKADLNDTRSCHNIIKIVFSNISHEDASSITLINNAGTIHPIKRIEDCTTEEVERNIHVNLMSPILLTSMFLQKIADWHVKKFIVNISSGAATRPVFGWSTYCTSKAGIEMFTKAAAEEQKVQKYPAIICSMAPGIVDTEMQSDIRSANQEDFIDLEKFKQYKEQDMLLKPSVVSDKLVELLASESLENGKNYHINNFL